MKSFPSAFATELAKKTGITPIWILRSTIDSVVYDCSSVSYQFPVGALNGFDTVLPWVSSWGSVRENISGNIGEILVADLPITFLVDQDDANNMRHLALQHELEKSPCELYLWLDGLDATTVPPQLMFRGYINDISIPDETQVPVVIEDESIRLKSFLGTKITSETFPLCDPDIVGKMIPIVYGSVDKLPALCVDSGWVTSLVTDLTAIATTVIVSELPAYPVVNKSVTIDDEQLLITAAIGTSLTVVRSQNGTGAVVHTKGSTVIEKKSTPLVYLCADHALDSIGTIMARVRGVDVDITTDCIKYLGTIGNQLAAYPGRAAITIPDFAKVYQRIAQAIQDSISVTDSSHTHATAATTADKTSYTISTLPVSGRAYPGTIPPHTYSSSYMSMCHAIMPDEGIVNSATLNISVSPGSIDWAIILSNSVNLSGYGVTIFTLYTQAKSGTYNLSLPIASASARQLRYIHICTLIPPNPGSYDVTYPMGIGPASITALNKVINVNIGGVNTTLSPSNVFKTGTVTLSGNSVADIMIGDAILVNCSRSITTPAAVFGNLLSTYCSDTSLVQVGTLPTFYAFNGAITEYKPVRDWLDILAFQCRCWFRKIAGVSKLIVRHAEPVSPTVISACALTSEGIKDLSYKKAPLNDVINVINVLYNRDWSSTGSRDQVYMSTQQSIDTVSIGNYGELEQPDMFMFDFVTSASMAADLAGFFHDFYAVRKWLVSFRTFLDRAALEFADDVQLSFANDLTGVIVEAGLQPGINQQIHSIEFTIATTHIPVEVANGIHTLLGVQVHTKNREVVTYV